MNILITGGAGFIGSHLSNSLASQENNIAIVDNLSKGNLSFLDFDDYNLFKVSIEDSTAVNKAVKQIQPDVVVHLAALHYIPECNEYPEKTWDINVKGTENILQACSFLDSIPYFVFASSASVYAPSKNKLDEGSNPEPLDVYGRTKLEGERLVKKSGLPYTILRLFNVYGPKETHNHLIPTLQDQFKNSSDIKLGNITSERDFIYVSDVVKAVKKVIKQKPKGEIFNIGTGNCCSAQDLVSIINDLKNKKKRIKQEESRMREVDNPYVCAKIDKAKRELDWLPEVKIEKGLRRLFD